MQVLENEHHPALFITPLEFSFSLALPSISVIISTEHVTIRLQTHSGSITSSIDNPSPILTKQMPSRKKRKKLTQMDEHRNSCEPVTERRSLWRRSGDAQFSDGHCRGLWWNLMHTMGFHSEPLLVCWFGFSSKLVFTHHHKLRIASVSQMRTTFILSAHMETGQRSAEIIMVSGQHHTSAHRYVHEITEWVVLQAGLL